MANGVINGKSPISGNTAGSWNRGPSAYELAVRYQGYTGDIISWLNSLKAYSPTIGEITETENGIEFTITDEQGEHLITLRNGKDITIISAEPNENGDIVVTFSDETVITIPKGEKGDKGDAPTFTANQDGEVSYTFPDSDSPTPLIDLGQLAREKVIQEYRDNPPVQVVRQLPSPEEAVEGVIYIVEEGD